MSSRRLTVGVSVGMTTKTTEQAELDKVREYIWHLLKVANNKIDHRIWPECPDCRAAREWAGR